MAGVSGLCGHGVAMVLCRHSGSPGSAASSTSTTTPAAATAATAAAGHAHCAVRVIVRVSVKRQAMQKV